MIDEIIIAWANCEPINNFIGILEIIITTVIIFVYNIGRYVDEHNFLNIII